MGKLNGEILVFGGPFGNLEATKEILKIAKERNIPASNIICTGDVTAYCANPQETSKMLKDSGIIIICGNCDENLGADMDDCGCGFEEESTCDTLAMQWYNFNKNNVDRAHKDWMRDLPERYKFEFHGKNFHVLHGSHNSINEFIFPSKNGDYKKSQITATGADVVLCGHNGMHFTSILGDKVWHNAGVIGMPANDGTPRTWYSLIYKEDNHICFTHKALDYDYEVTAKKMIENNFTDYANTIQNGLWPSDSMLPEAEKSIAGQAFKETTCKWDIKK